MRLAAFEGTVGGRHRPGRWSAGHTPRGEKPARVHGFGALPPDGVPSGRIGMELWELTARQVVHVLETAERAAASADALQRHLVPR